MRSVSFQTLGCKLNQYDTQVLMDSFMEAPGYLVVEPEEPAEISIINTCTVTARTDRQSRNLIRRAAGRRPKPVVVVTGCYAEVDPDASRNIRGVDHVIPNRSKWSDFEEVFGIHIRQTIRGFRNHTRAFVKVQEGCGNLCSYCVVSRARGEERARPVSAVLEEVEGLAGRGYREVVLTGTDLGRYADATGKDLPILLSMLGGVKDLRRIRLSSIHPDRVTGRLLDLFSFSPMMCRHVHLSIQSADDRILSLMNRSYTRKVCEGAIEDLLRACPEMALGADFIVGFPGEDERAFRNTVDFFHGSGLAYVHVFPFSARAGTCAESLAGQVAPQVKKERADLLRAAGRLRWLEYRRRFLGRELVCLVESRRKDGKLVGLSDNYIHVDFDGGDELKRELVPVLLSRVHEEGNCGVVSNGRSGNEV